MSDRLDQLLSEMVNNWDRGPELTSVDEIIAQIKQIYQSYTTNKIIEELEAVQLARSLMSDLPNRDRVTEEELAKRIKALNHRKENTK